MTFQRHLLVALREYMSWLPEASISLRATIGNRGYGEQVQPECGAICCAWGWAPNVPEFGMTRNKRGEPSFDGENWFDWEEAHIVLGISYTEGRDLFTWRGNSRLDPADSDEDDDNPITDRELFLSRVDQFLALNPA